MPTRYQECVDACLECMKACNFCFNACLIDDKIEIFYDPQNPISVAPRVP